MSSPTGETTVPIGDWTTGTLKIYHDEKIALLERYFERRFTDQDKAVQAALLAAKEAVLKAEVASEKRFESVNEFRRTLSDQTNTFLPRPEYDSNHKALEDKIDALTDRMNRSDGKSSGLNAGWGYLAGAIGLAATVISIILAFNN